MLKNLNPNTITYLPSLFDTIRTRTMYPNEGYISPASQSGVGGEAWVEKFVLNLCYLYFKVPEFVLLLTFRDKLISFGGAEEMLAPQRDVGSWA